MKNRNRTHCIHFILPVAVMVFIFIQSAFPADLSLKESDPIAQFLAGLFHLESQTASFLVRKCAHFLEYLVLGITLAFPVRDCIRRKVSAFACAWAIGIAYAVSDEFHQRFVSGRSCELRDILIDSAGVLIGLLLTYFVLYVRAVNSRLQEPNR